MGLELERFYCRFKMLSVFLILSVLILSNRGAQAQDFQQVPVQQYDAQAQPAPAQAPAQQVPVQQAPPVAQQQAPVQQQVPVQQQQPPVQQVPIQQPPVQQQPPPIQQVQGQQPPLSQVPVQQQVPVQPPQMQQVPMQPPPPPMHQVPMQQMPPQMQQMPPQMQQMPPQMQQMPPQMQQMPPQMQQVPQHMQQMPPQMQQMPQMPMQGVPMPQMHPGQVPMQPLPGQMPPMHQGLPQNAPPPMINPLFDENSSDPAVAMEYKVHVDPGKEECYFQFVQKGATIFVSFQVLRGGDGMAGFAVRDPTGQLVHPYQWKPASEHQEVSPTGGYYGICVDNQFSRFAAKLVNLYITTFRYDQWEKFTQELRDIDVSAENCTNALMGVDKRIHTILQLQQQARGKEARDYNLLLANESYVQYWSIAQCAVVVACFTLQVFFVRKLFETKPGARGRI